MNKSNCTNNAMADSIAHNKQNIKKWYLYGQIIIANIPAITSGMMISWPSPVLVKLNSLGEQNPLGHVISTTNTAIIGSALSFGAIIGPYLAAYLPEKIGRKYTLLSLAITFIIGLLILSFAKHVYLYYTARLIIGFAYGSVYTLLPIYLIEFSGDNNRGVVINTTAFCTIFGSLLSLSIGPFTSIMVFCLICATFPVVFIVLFFTLMPETPQDLLLMGKTEEAKEMYFKMNLGTADDFEIIKHSITTKIKTPYREILKVKSNIKIVAITILLVTFKQFSGINVITSYTQSIFEAAGGNMPSEISPIIIELIMLFCTMLVPYFIETNGRKFLLKLSAAGMTVFFAVTGVYFYLEKIQDVSNIAWLPIVGFIGAKISFNLGFGPVVWVIMSELLPYNVKAAGSALTNSFCWGILFIASFAFPIITENAGLAVSFWIFSGMNLIAFIFCSVVVPETKGKTVQEIQDMFRK